MPAPSSTLGLLGAALVAAAALASPAGVAAARVRGRGAGGAALQPAGAALDEAFAANEAALHSLQAAAERRDALLQAGSTVTPAATPAEEGTVQPELEESPSELKREEELREERAEALRPEGLAALDGVNRFHAQLMDPHAGKAVLALLGRLRADQTFVRLENPVRGGHLVRFRLVRGSAAAVVARAAEAGATVNGNELDVPPHPEHGEVVRASAVQATQHNAGVVVNQAKEPVDVADATNFPDFVDRDVPSAERLELAANNHHEVSKLACPVCEKFAALTVRLAREDTFVRLYGAIPSGHTADYQLVRGARATVRAIAAEVGLEAGDSQITAPPAPGADAVHAEAEVTHGFEAATTNEGAGELLN